ncbi:MAG: hypothetical protein KDB23_12670 [Planctomycetales bacterium]|nr:hypothetical protein [Planctomycetales bacterium]
MRFQQLRILFCLLAIGVAVPAHGDITISTESKTFIADGVNPVTGTFDVYLDVPSADAGQLLLSWNVTSFVSSATGTIDPSDVVFNPSNLGNNSPQFDPVAPHLDVFPFDGIILPTSNLAIVNPKIAFSSDAGAAVSVSQGTTHGLVQIPFRVPAGEFGTFTVSLYNVETAIFNDEFSEIASTLGSGTITISAVPEPSAFLFLGFSVVIGFAMKLSRSSE